MSNTFVVDLSEARRAVEKVRGYIEISKSQRIDGEYEIMEKIGSGAHSEVFRVQSRDGTELAAKVVDEEYASLLRNENEAMPSKTDKIYPGQVYYKYFFGRHGGFYALVMDLLGKSISHLHKKYNGLSRETILMLGIQMTSRVEELHSRGYLHRDIKPDNLVIGNSGDDLKYMYLIDLGLATKFRDSGNIHKMQSTGQKFVGTRYFASRQSHRGEQQSRRSDLESAVYTMIHLFRGCLPWKGLSIAETGRLKEDISSEDLCLGVPEGVVQYCKYVRRLGYAERPDYPILRRHLKAALTRYGEKLDYKFEWN